MKIDKSIGNWYWCEKGESDELDDIAYQLYLNNYYNMYNAYSLIYQRTFVTIRYISKHEHHIYYKQANIILRKQKLLKLNENR